eukprot:PhM_4_TR2075/c3_g1_i1/m.6993
MLWRGDHLVTSSTGSAGDNASSFAAENHALHLAPNGIQQCHVSTDIIRIVTDSLSNVVMLAKGPISQTTPQGMLLWQRLIDIASHVRRIDIAFVFGHCSLPRGDTVDLEAKRAVATTSSPPPISFQEMLKDIGIAYCCRCVCASVSLGTGVAIGFAEEPTHGKNEKIQRHSG